MGEMLRVVHMLRMLRVVLRVLVLRLLVLGRGRPAASSSGCIAGITRNTRITPITQITLDILCDSLLGIHFSSIHL